MLAHHWPFADLEQVVRDASNRHRPFILSPASGEGIGWGDASIDHVLEFIGVFADDLVDNFGGQARELLLDVFPRFRPDALGVRVVRARDGIGCPRRAEGRSLPDNPPEIGEMASKHGVRCHARRDNRETRCE